MSGDCLYGTSFCVWLRNQIGLGIPRSDYSRILDDAIVTKVHFGRYPVIAINVNYAWYGIKRDIFWNIRSPVIQWLLLGSGMAMVICGVHWMFVGTPAERQKKGNQEDED